MEHTVKHGPSASMLQIDLGPGEEVRAAVGAMVARSAGVRMDVRPAGRRSAGPLATLLGLLAAALRKLLGGSAFLVNRFSSRARGWVWLAPAMSGGVQHVPLRGSAMIFRARSFLASAGDVDLAVQSGRGLAELAEEGSLLRASGSGDVWVSSYGALEEIECDGACLVDGGHVVGFDAALGITVRRGGACELTGRGRVLVQARSAEALVGWLSPLLPP